MFSWANNFQRARTQLSIAESAIFATADPRIPTGKPQSFLAAGDSRRLRYHTQPSRAALLDAAPEWRIRMAVRRKNPEIGRRQKPFAQCGGSKRRGRAQLLGARCHAVFDQSPVGIQL